MAPLPLTAGAYKARNAIGGMLVCENCFPEVNPEETKPPAPTTHYPREGLRPLSAPPNAGLGRGLFTLSNGALLGVVGSSVYFIDQGFVWHLLGTIAAAPTPVSMSDNGVTGVLVDGSPNGYQIALAGNVFAPIVDSTGTFIGSRRADFCDTFLGFAAPGTNEWYVTLSGQVAFNALVEANKDSTPDPIQTFGFNLRNAWLLGTQNTEVWYLAGSTPFPYQEWPNVFIPYGCAAPYSLVRADIDLFWISRNAQGQAMAIKTNGMSAIEGISTRALEFEWSTYARVDDVIGGTYQRGGHTFVIFHFPTADKTWAYDLSSKQWHRRTFIDANGVPHREKVSFYATVGADGGYPPWTIAQDWQTGQIYVVDPNFYTDNGQPIVCKRSFPHVVGEMKQVTHSSFVADFATGGILGAAEADPNPPQLVLRCSRNGGVSFGNGRPKGLVSAGHYRSMMRWRGLGIARDMIYQLEWSYNGPSALNGAFIEPVGHGS